MPIEKGPTAVQDRILWVHDDDLEQGESDNGRYVNYFCPNCKYSWWADLND